MANEAFVSARLLVPTGEDGLKYAGDNYRAIDGTLDHDHDFARYQRVAENVGFAKAVQQTSCLLACLPRQPITVKLRFP